MNLRVNSSVKKLVIIFFIILLFFPPIYCFCFENLYLFYSLFILKCFICFFFTGFGVFTKTDIEKGEFILEYSGERITIQEAEKREKRRKGKHSYLFYFQWNGLKW